jgi:PhnB protein
MLISVMLAVPDAKAAADWYQKALGADLLWDLGSVIGLEIHGAPFFLGQPEHNGWETPEQVGTTTTRIEVFVQDPEALIERAVEHGAQDATAPRNYDMPWGPHLQGGFVDPFGHRWLVGDSSPLQIFPGDY